MKKLSSVILAAIFCIFFYSCQKDYSESNPEAGPEVVDADAKKFFDSSRITDDIQKRAIADLVKKLKDSSLWTKFSAIYPFVGENAASAKWNLKDPRDLDVAYRLTFHGNPVFKATGVLFPTTADYADSHLVDSTMIPNDNSISFFSRTQNKVSGYDMGCHDNISPYNQMAIYHDNDAIDYFGLYSYGYQPESTKGLFMISATQSDVVWYENGVPKFQKNESPKSGFTGYPILIGWCQNATSGGQRECAFASIGKGFSSKEAMTIYNIVAKYQAALKR